MSVDPSSINNASGDTKDGFTSRVDKDTASSDSSINLEKEVFDVTQVDPVLAKKMALINQAIEEIGMTPFQWKLFFLNGFGYAVDSVRNASSPDLCLAD